MENLDKRFICLGFAKQHHTSSVVNLCLKGGVNAQEQDRIPLNIDDSNLC